MNKDFADHWAHQLDGLKRDGLYKSERVITSPQSGSVELDTGRSLINLCANNYLGLSNDPALVAHAHDALDRYGYGMSSVRFICGTQDVHKQLEIPRISPNPSVLSRLSR